MGSIYKLTEQYLPEIDHNSIFVEIGSDRYEGSTRYFAELAGKNNTILHTVDLDPECQQRNADIENVTWYQHSGSDWASTVFPTVGKQIACLYLDNFDYNWDINVHSEMIEKQRITYRSQFDIEMTNQNCQIEHMKQLLALYPYMGLHSVIVCDDTYLWNDCWVGKSGPAVVFLLANGYTVQHTTTDCGVILKR